MKLVRLIGPLLLILLGLLGQGCAAELTPEQKQVVADLKQDLARIRQEIKGGTQDDAGNPPSKAGRSEVEFSQRKTLQ